MTLFLKHTFETSFDLNPSGFNEKLSAHLVKPNLVNALRVKKDKLFYGEVYDGHFKIWRIANKRKGSMPNIEGRFGSDSRGVKVHVEMEPDHQIFTFLIAWTVGTIGLGILSAIFHEIFGSTSLYCWVLFILGIFLIYQYFWSEVPISKNRFLEIFKD